MFRRPTTATYDEILAKRIRNKPDNEHTWLRPVEGIVIATALNASEQTRNVTDWGIEELTRRYAATLPIDKAEKKAKERLRSALLAITTIPIASQLNTILLDTLHGRDLHQRDDSGRLHEANWGNEDCYYRDAGEEEYEQRQLKGPAHNAMRALYPFVEQAVNEYANGIHPIWHRQHPEYAAWKIAAELRTEFAKNRGSSIGYDDPLRRLRNTALQQLSTMVLLARLLPDVIPANKDRIYRSQHVALGHMTHVANVASSQPMQDLHASLESDVNGGKQQRNKLQTYGTDTNAGLGWSSAVTQERLWYRSHRIGTHLRWDHSDGVPVLRYQHDPSRSAPPSLQTCTGAIKVELPDELTPTAQRTRLFEYELQAFASCVDLESTLSMASPRTFAASAMKLFNNASALGALPTLFTSMGITGTSFGDDDWAQLFAAPGNAAFTRDRNTSGQTLRL